jgi:UDPglucose 6-dehydrogenase
MGGEVRGKTVGILGLTFKPNTDDMRDSPAIAVIQALQDAGAIIRAYDPEGMEQASKLLTNVTFCSNAYEVCEAACALVLVTEWDAFRALDLARVVGLLAEPLLVDLRNVYPIAEAERAGLRYVGIGQPRGERRLSRLKAMSD